MMEDSRIPKQALFGGLIPFLDKKGLSVDKKLLNEEVDGRLRLNDVNDSTATSEMRPIRQEPVKCEMCSEERAGVCTYTYVTVSSRNRRLFRIGENHVLCRSCRLGPLT